MEKRSFIGVERKRYSKTVCEVEFLSTSLLGAEVRITYNDGSVRTETFRRKDILTLTHDINFDTNNDSPSKVAIETFLDLVGFSVK